MSETIAVIGALDTKGSEFAFVKGEIGRRGHRALVINTVVVGDPAFEPDTPASRVAEAGGVSLEELREKGDRGVAMDVMARGVAVLVKELHDEGKLDAVLGMGGTAGTAVSTSAMRALPVGVPKVVVSTVASGGTSRYVGTKDVVMVPSIVDVAGINRISARIYANAVGAGLSWYLDQTFATVAGRCEMDVLPAVGPAPLTENPRAGSTSSHTSSPSLPR